eukprot:15355089-Alexandrium_andersonii.AAC.1
MDAAGILLQTGIALSRSAPGEGQDWTTQAKRDLLTKAITTIRTVEHDFEIHIIEAYDYLNECTLNLPTDRLNSFILQADYPLRR